MFDLFVRWLFVFWMMCVAAPIIGVALDSLDDLIWRFRRRRPPNRN